MATQTTNYKLKKPALTDAPDITNLNANWDLIDTLIKTLNDNFSNYVPTTRKVNGKPLSADITLSASDVGADKTGSASAVQSNLNSHTSNKSNPHGVTTTQIGAVPTSRTVNGKALSTDISLNASDVGADASGAASGVQTNLNSHTSNKSNPHGVTAAQVGAVPTTRKVNNKSLSGDIDLSASDVGAAPAYTSGTEDMQAGVSELAENILYFVYE